MKGRNYAREKSEISHKVRPLGQFIVGCLHEARSQLQIPQVSRLSPPRVVAAEQSQSGLPAGATCGTSVPTVGPQPESEPAFHRVRREREASVLHACLAWLHRQGIFAWRQNTGTLWTGGTPVSFGLPGAADITGLLPDGRRLEIECKSATGTQSEKQKRFQAKIEASRGVYLLVRSERDLEEQWAKYCSATVLK